MINKNRGVIDNLLEAIGDIADESGRQAQIHEEIKEQYLDVERKVKNFKDNVGGIYEQLKYFGSSDEFERDIKEVEEIRENLRKTKRKHIILRILIAVITVIICIFI